MTTPLDPGQVAITMTGERYHKIIWWGASPIIGERAVATRCGLDSVFLKLSVVSWEDVPWQPCKTCFGKDAKRREAT